MLHVVRELYPGRKAFGDHRVASGDRPLAYVLGGADSIAVDRFLDAVRDVICVVSIICDPSLALAFHTREDSASSR